MAAQRNASFVALTRASLTAAAALALTRVFAGGAWLFAVAFAAFVPPAFFALADRRRWPALVPFAATLLAGTWLATLVDDPGDTVAGIPGASALSQLRTDLGQAAHVLRSATVPVRPIGAALVLAVLATLLAALATELVARKLEAPIGAIGPSVALYVALSALGSGPWARTTAVYAITIVAYLVALQHAEMTARRTWFQSERTRRSQLATGGVVGGALLIALAITIGPLFPGARGAAWINYRSLGAGNGQSLLTAYNPLASINAKLTGADSNREVFSVKTSDGQPYRWRVVALDKFKDNDWSLNADRRSASHLRGRSSIGTSLVTEQFQIGEIDPYWLPAAYRATSIDLKNAQVLPSSVSLFVAGDAKLTDLSYTVTSEITKPALATLQSVSYADLGDQSDDTKLPPAFSKKARDLAQNLTKGATGPYDAALKLEDFFQRSGKFTYDLKVNLGTSASALDTFLFRTRTGFCEQFATAFAELARSVHLPTRIAVGYQPGDFESSDGRYHVHEKEAHAWPEVWLGPKVGWYAFEPTPGHQDPVTKQGETGGPGGTNPSGSTTTTPTTGVHSTAPGSGKIPPTETPKGNVQVPPASTNTPKSTQRSNVVTGVLVALVVLVVLALAALVALVVAVRRRTHRRRFDPDTRSRVLGAWTEALERLTAAGVERRPATTSVEFALRQAPADGAGPAGPPLMDLARLHTAAMFAAEPPSSEDADAAWTLVDAIDAALRTTVSGTTRWRARVRQLFRERHRRELERVSSVRDA